MTQMTDSRTALRAGPKSLTATRDLTAAATVGSASRLWRESIFLDFQATTPLDPIVLDAMLPWMSGAWNAHAIEHGIGRTASHAVEEAREKVAALLGCEPSEITFTSGRDRGVQHRFARSHARR